MCEETVIRSCISLEETFSNPFTFKMISKYGKGAVLHIGTVFGPV